MEYIGEIVANILGLNDSKYQWVIDSMTDEEVDQMKEDQERILSEVRMIFHSFFISNFLRRSLINYVYFTFLFTFRLNKDLELERRMMMRRRMLRRGGRER